MTASREQVDVFIARWEATGGSERANYQMFLTELCDLIGVPGPAPSVQVVSRNDYVFERRIPAQRLDGPTTSNFIDLYKRGCFVLEAKQSRKRIEQFEQLKQLSLDVPAQQTGSGRRNGGQWDTLMRNAREQAETYAKRLPVEEGWPPFLVIVDVAHVIELYADFSLQGKHYAQFPDRQSYRIYLEDLRDEAVRQRLHDVWTDPQSLNPARRTAQVTREIAELLAKLSKSLETRMMRAAPKERQEDAAHTIAEKVALFLMRCLFTMFAEDQGRPITRWNGVATKLHPITGEEIPDESARIELRTYFNPRQASWPKANFIVGNPPFVGGKDMRQELGDGYAEACWKARGYIPGGADFVMHFWDKAAEMVRTGKARAFGLITTNSITQNFSRRVVQRHLGAKKPLSLAMAVPDHPWLKSAEKAAVRIAMTVGVAGSRTGALREVTAETGLGTDTPTVELSERTGKIQPDLSIGADVASVVALQANEKLSSPGVKLHGAGFIVTPQQALSLGLGTVKGLEKHILPYRNGRDLTARPRGVLVIDLFPLMEFDLRERFPAVCQWVADRVKPERDHNNRMSYRENWWIFGEPRRELRPALQGLPRYVATVETSKHRFFQFLEASVRPDNMLIAISLDDAYFLGVLSSRIHVTWALAAGGRLGVGNDPRYNKTRCFDPFPFPDASEALKTKIRAFAEQLDVHRKSALEKHRHLTMTGLYNVLEKLRAAETLTEAEKDIYESGLVGVLREIHDDLDAAVAEAYGWPAELSEDEILGRLVALNHERAAEEAAGTVRWLRPDFQAPKESAAKKARQIEADLVMAEGAAKKPRLPAALPEQVAAVRAALAEHHGAVTPIDLARRFTQGRRVETKVEEVLRTLALLGQAEWTEQGYVLTR